MQTKGFPFNGKTYDDGPHFSVNSTKRATLQSAISSHGPVKIGVGADISNRMPMAWSRRGQVVGRCTTTQKTRGKITA